MTECERCKVEFARKSLTECGVCGSEICRECWEELGRCHICGSAEAEEDQEAYG